MSGKEKHAYNALVALEPHIKVGYIVNKIANSVLAVCNPYFMSTVHMY